MDLCVGDFWETPERRQLAPMSASLDVDVLSLVAASTVQPLGPAYFYGAIFMPFQNDVWILCAGPAPLPFHAPRDGLFAAGARIPAPPLHAGRLDRWWPGSAQRLRSSGPPSALSREHCV